LKIVEASLAFLGTIRRPPMISARCTSCWGTATWPRRWSTPMSSTAGGLGVRRPADRLWQPACRAASWSWPTDGRSWACTALSCHCPYSDV